MFPEKDGAFEIKRFVHKGRGELGHPDEFHTIRELIGRKLVLG